MVAGLDSKKKTLRTLNKTGHFTKVPVFRLKYERNSYNILIAFYTKESKIQCVHRYGLIQLRNGRQINLKLRQIQIASSWNYAVHQSPQAQYSAVHKSIPKENNCSNLQQKGRGDENRDSK